MKENFVPIVRKSICKLSDDNVVEELRSLDAVHWSFDRVQLAPVLARINKTANITQFSHIQR
jgi:hypothetical protein